MIRILVADDHTIVRRGLKQIVADTPDIVVSGEASKGDEVLQKVWENDYDIVLLDIAMPGRGGLETLRELKSLKPKLPVLVLSIYPEDQYALRVLKAGAAGYLTKESASEELVTAIRKVACGGKYVSPYLAEKLVSGLGVNIEKPPHQMLSNREYQIMCMIASGKTINEIAEELSLSKKTISTYRTRILLKMHMKKNAELIRYAVENRLLD